jgi:ActR/RegA family two-component response regulator
MPDQAIVLEDDDDLREILGSILEVDFGLTPVLMRRVASLVALGPGALAARLAILDVNLGPGEPSGLDAYTWLRDQGYEGRIVFLTGHAMNHPLVNRACQLGDARVLAKPVSVEQLAALIPGSAP